VWFIQRETIRRLKILAKAPKVITPRLKIAPIKRTVYSLFELCLQKNYRAQLLFFVIVFKSQFITLCDWFIVILFHPKAKITNIWFVLLHGYLFLYILCHWKWSRWDGHFTMFFPTQLIHPQKYIFTFESTMEIISWRPTTNLQNQDFQFLCRLLRRQIAETSDIISWNCCMGTHTRARLGMCVCVAPFMDR